MSNAEKMLLTVSKGTGPSCTVEYLRGLYEILVKVETADFLAVLLCG